MADPTRDVLDETAPPVFRDAVEIRGRRGLHAVLALAAVAVAVAYAVRIGSGASPAWWALVALLAVVAAVNVAMLASRAPSLVADEKGVRVRSGRRWTGLPWEGIDSVRVQRPAGRVGDSVLVLVPTGEQSELRVPHGAAAKVSAPDLLEALSQLRREHERGARAATVVTEAPARQVAEAPEAPPPAAHVSEAAPTARRASPLASARRAVRSQVHREGAATVGSSALKQEPHAFPEIRELRRTEGKVGLVVETVPTGSATTGAVPATAVGAAPVEAYPTQPAPEPLIGPQIAAARHYVRVSVDGLAERTRIRPHVIESIEVDDFVPCGGDFYARGHLRSLCRTLGIDAAALLEVYDREYAQAPVAARRVFEAELATGPQAAIRSTGGGPRWSVLLGVVMVLAILWGAAKIVTDRTADPAPETSAVALPSVPQQPSGPTGLAGVGAPQVSTIRLVASGPASVSVRDADGFLLWGGTMAAGQRQRFDVDGPATVRASDGGAVAVLVNGERVGVVGESGRPARRTVGGTGR